MQPWLDGSLYPDTDAPDSLNTLADLLDFLARLCSVRDFGVLPREFTVNGIRNPEWKPVVDTC